MDCAPAHGHHVRPGGPRSIPHRAYLLFLALGDAIPAQLAPQGVRTPRRVFVGRNGEPMRGDAIRQGFARARDKVGMDGFRFHDLRHTGQTLAASTGATLKDLMKRLGHASAAAANRYLHAVDGRDAEIAAALSELATTGDASKLPRSIVR